MSSAAKLAANIANAQLSTGPRTPEGRAASSKNALKSGLFAVKDFIRPGEEPAYTQLDERLRADLVPASELKHILVDEIRRAAWRLRRCGEIESGMVVTLADAHPASPIPDPMQFEPTAKLQESVDRARAQCHRILHRCTGELRKLQTERHVRNEVLEAGTDLTDFGVCDLRTIQKVAGERVSAELVQRKLNTIVNDALAERNLNHATAVPMDFLASIGVAPAAPKPVTKPTQPSRNSRCACGSGQKYKRCCGKVDGPNALLKAA